MRVGAVPAAAAGGAAAASAGAWTAVAVPEISRRIEEYASSEIRFNLLALVRDKRAVLAEQLQRTVARAEATFAVAESFEPGALAGVGPDPVALAASFEKEIPEFAAAAAAPEPSGDAPAAGAAGGAGVGAGGMAVDGGAPFEPASTLDELRVQYAGLLAEGERLRSEYAAEKEKRDRWRVENGELSLAGNATDCTQIRCRCVLLFLARPGHRADTASSACNRRAVFFRLVCTHLQRAAGTTSCHS